jgi:hypothetical protein
LSYYVKKHVLAEKRAKKSKIALATFFECGIPMPQDAGTPLLSLLQNFNLYIILIAVLENVPPTQGYRKEPPFNNRRSGRDRGTNTGHLRGGQRRKTLSDLNISKKLQNIFFAEKGDFGGNGGLKNPDHL